MSDAELAEKEAERNAWKTKEDRLWNESERAKNAWLDARNVRLQLDAAIEREEQHRAWQAEYEAGLRGEINAKAGRVQNEAA